ncbi:aminoglycoside phosphotransferase family protein [Actinoplanes bogorensis]|uniref:Aminoglycoside phosphotransferase family protein n=2 Tax=Paractinoplanes bogorensis TaxID=1610840 RepID=A0ABS5YT53_9ACTN|nr:aminoglycoside phosphotransferase family protein [Actinoplanes bogorensis]
MHDVMRRMAVGLNVDASDAHLLHMANNATFVLPSAGLVIRIIRSRTLLDRVHKVVELGGYFGQVGAPTIRLAEEIIQPVADGDALASVWQWVPPTDPTPDARDLGVALRQFHALGLPPFSLLVWDPIGDAHRRISDAEALDESDRDYLLAWCDRLQPQLEAFAAGQPAGLVHGDAHQGNLLREQDGRILLCDFDATCAGPWQVDLVPAPANEARFGPSGAHKQLASAYGYDITTDPAWPLLQEARELKMVVGGVPMLVSSPGAAAEFRLRLDSIRDKDYSVRWTAFSDLAGG